MKDLSDIGLIGADSIRTRAYLQLLLREGYRLHTCYIMAENPALLEKEAASYANTESGSVYFKREEPVLYTLQNANIPYVLVQTNNINSPQALKAVCGAAESYLIYSGFSGQIIKEEVFCAGKTLIHVHSGILPQYRGSTTVYYSLLREGWCGASAIIMAPKLDSGEVIAEARFPMPPKGVNIDYVYDPFIRAKVLIAAINSYIERGFFTGRLQAEHEEVTYFVAHPVLRHIVGLMQDPDGGT